MTTGNIDDGMEFITIMGASIEDVNRECRAQRLTEREFSIVSKIGRHQLTIAEHDADNEKICGRQFVGATFARRIHA